MQTEIDPRKYATLRRMVHDERFRVVVSFGGGAVPGIAGNLALARLLELLDLRKHIDQIWGTSAGAVVGGGWATGTPADEILRLVRDLNRRGSVDIQWLKLAAAMLLRPFGRPLPDGIIAGKRFRDAIDRGLRRKSFEECEIEFRCIAIRDDGSMRKRVFRNGKLLQAIFSSMSLPGIVIPVLTDDDPHSYYDGGLVEKTPLISPIAEHLRGDGRRDLLILGTHFDNEAKKLPARGFISRFLQTIYAMEDEMWHYQLDEARRRDGVNLLLLNPDLQDKSLFDFSRVDANYVAAFASFADQLQDAKIGYAMGTV